MIDVCVCFVWFARHYINGYNFIALFFLSKLHSKLQNSIVQTETETIEFLLCRKKDGTIAEEEKRQHVIVTVKGIQAVVVQFQEELNSLQKEIQQSTTHTCMFDSEGKSLVLCAAPTSL
jgi:hypothetical protein